MKLFPRIFLVAVTITGLGIFTTLFIGSADIPTSLCDFCSTPARQSNKKVSTRVAS